jgi:molecular chaperone DnaK
MRRDADSHAADDKKKRELAEARNLAEQRVYQLEKLLEESKDKLSETDQTALRAAIDKVNEAKKSDDLAAINRAVDELQKASQAMAEHLYASASTPGPGGPSASAPGGDGSSASGQPGDGATGPKPDDVIDVEFEKK